MPVQTKTASNVPRDPTSGQPISPGTQAAAGSTTTDATVLTSDINVITAANGTKGVRIPANAKGRRFSIINTVSGQNLKVYPPTGGTLNYGIADANITVGGQTSCIIDMQTDLIGYSIPATPS